MVINDFLSFAGNHAVNADIKSVVEQLVDYCVGDLHLMDGFEVKFRVELIFDDLGFKWRLDIQELVLGFGLECVLLWDVHDAAQVHCDP